MLYASPSEQSGCGLIITTLRSQAYELFGVPLTSQEQRKTQNFHPPGGLYAVLMDPLGRFAKGDLDSWQSTLSHYSCMPALEEEVYVVHHLHLRSPLMPSPPADPGNRHGTNRCTCVIAWLRSGSRPLPTAHTSLSPAQGNKLIPFCQDKNSHCCPGH